MKQKHKDILKIVFAILLLSILYLYSLNGRYIHLANGVVLDKWKNEAITVGSEQLPIIK